MAWAGGRVRCEDGRMDGRREGAGGNLYFAGAADRAFVSFRFVSFWMVIELFVGFGEG